MYVHGNKPNEIFSVAPPIGSLGFGIFRIAFYLYGCIRNIRIKRLKVLDVLSHLAGQSQCHNYKYR